MSFPSPSLDDRRFQEIVDEAKQLIPKYCPEWTNHNLSDPGVALIELFAWMTEMIIYRVNRVPDRLYTKFLDLMGMSPFPAAPAACDLTFWLTSTDLEPVTIPPGTEVGTLATPQQDSIVFTTDQALRIAQPGLIACSTAAGGSTTYVDQWDELLYERSDVACFAGDPPRPGDAVYFGFDEPLAGNLIQCTIGAVTAGLGIDPDRPPLAWEVWSGEQWIPATIRSDGTGGLNRSGAIELFIPLAHQPLTLGPTRAHWLRAVVIPAEEGQPPYSATPRLRGFAAISLGGTVPAHHGTRTGPESLGRSNGAPGQVFRVRHTPVHPRKPGETLRVVTEDGTDEWDEVPDFSGSGPEDPDYVWDGSSGEIRFGPEIRFPDVDRSSGMPVQTIRRFGAVPKKGAEIVIHRYTYGGGTVGNVGAGTLTSLVRSIPFVDRVSNLEPAFGGVDAEDIENAKARAPLVLRTANRAVTAADYERLTLEAAPQAARARALPPAEPGGPIRLLVVPRVEIDADLLVLDDLALSDELVEQIADYLEDRRTLGSRIEIATPYYQGVSAVARLTAATGRQPDLVRQRVLDALYDFVNPIEGGPDGTGWPFAWDLNAGAVFQRLVSVPGVDRVDEVLLFEGDLRTRRRHGRGKERVDLSDNALFMSMSHYVLVS